MRRIVASTVAVLLLLAVSTPAFAGAAANAALGLASFAVFSSLFWPVFNPWPVYAAPTLAYGAPPVVYAAPPVVYAPPPISYTPPAPPAPPARVVQYAHGRYELHWLGQQYVWVWIPNPAATPPPPPPAGR